MVLGIVGKIGSGKSTIIEYIKKNYDAIVFYCDDIAKDIMEKGETDYNPGFAGEIFINEKKQEECRTILHPLVFRRINEIICRIKNENNFSNKNNQIKGEFAKNPYYSNYNEFSRINANELNYSNLKCCSKSNGEFKNIKGKNTNDHYTQKRCYNTRDRQSQTAS